MTAIFGVSQLSWMVYCAGIRLSMELFDSIFGSHWSVAGSAVISVGISMRASLFPVIFLAPYNIVTMFPLVILLSLWPIFTLSNNFNSSALW